MNTSELNRFAFHSKEDISAGYNLRKAEELFNRPDLTSNMQIIDLLELYNIKQYFDNDLFLLTLDETTKSGYKEIQYI